MQIHNTALGQFANRNWAMHNSKMSKALERLSSGLRINRAADDPGNIGVSERMKAQLSALGMSRLNSIQEASRAEMRGSTLQGMQSMLLRMKELATQSANGTYSDLDRENLDKEFQALADEIDNLGRAYSASQNAPSKFKPLETEKNNSSVNTSTVLLEFKGGNINAFLDALDLHLNKIAKARANGDNEALKALNIDMSSGKTNAEMLQASILEFTKENGEKLLNTPSDTSRGEFTATITKDGLSVTKEAVSARTLGLSDSNLLTQDNASKAIKAIEAAMKSVASQLGDVGAWQRRLDNTLNRIDSMEQNLTDALSRILDADMAKEMMIFTREKALAQAAAFAMAHVNQQAEEVLKVIGIM